MMYWTIAKMKLIQQKEQVQKTKMPSRKQKRMLGKEQMLLKTLIPQMETRRKRAKWKKIQMS